jgi:hypothetical protein
LGDWATACGASVRARRGRWLEVGGSMIAVDTLLHNFLHRTGILHRFEADHSYGPACYRPRGCAEIIATVAGENAARQHLVLGQVKVARKSPTRSRTCERKRMQRTAKGIN